MTLAALCHDLGHGPFSHSFEKVMEDLQRDEAAAADGPVDVREWHHEQNRLPPLVRFLLVYRVIFASCLPPVASRSPFLSSPLCALIFLGENDVYETRSREFEADSSLGLSVLLASNAKLGAFERLTWVLCMTGG